MGISYPSNGVCSGVIGVYSIEYGVSDPVVGISKMDGTTTSPTSGDAGDSLLLFNSEGITLLHLGMI